jgi:hypothetical protein
MISQARQTGANPEREDGLPRSYKRASEARVLRPSSSLTRGRLSLSFRSFLRSFR